MEATTNAFIQAVAINNDILKKNCDTKIKELQILLDDLKKQQTQLLFEKDKHASKQDIINFVKTVITQSEEQSDQDFYQQMIDTIVRAVYAKDNEYTIWFVFDDTIPPITFEDMKEIDKMVDEHIKKNADQLNGSAPNVSGRG